MENVPIDYQIKEQYYSLLKKYAGILLSILALRFAFYIILPFITLEFGIEVDYNFLLQRGSTLLLYGLNIVAAVIMYTDMRRFHLTSRTILLLTLFSVEAGIIFFMIVVLYYVLRNPREGQIDMN